MLQPKVASILPRADNQPKAKSGRKAKPVHNLPEVAFPTAHDLKHAMLIFTPCYGCGRVVPESGMFPKCDGCGARMCRICESSCACDDIEMVREAARMFSGAGTAFLAPSTDSTPCDSRIDESLRWILSATGSAE